MKTLFVEDLLTYDGSAIRAHWARRRFGLEGDAAVGFLGRCDVLPGEVADMDEVISGEPIRAEAMAHVVAEHFGPTLEEAILRLHLLAALALEALAPRAGGSLVRKGNDLYLGSGKMSVGVATVTPVSVKIHFGVNVSARGVPVKAAGLEDLGVAPRGFVEDLLARYARESVLAREARTKVRGVGGSADS